MRPAELKDNLLVAGTVIAMTGLLLSGSIRFAFNAIGLRVFGAGFLGAVNPAWSGFVLAATLLSGPAGLILGRAAATHLGAGRPTRAGEVLRMMVLLVVVVGVPASIAATRLATGQTHVLAWLVGASALQMTLKAAYYAFRRHRAYFTAELLAALAFFAVFVPACATGSAGGATTSVLVYPACFCMIGLWHFRDVLSARGEGSAWREALGGLGPLYLPSLVLTMHGLTAFHGVILLSGLLLDPVQVGYVSVIIASLAPLHLLPAALNTTLFPEIARRTGQKRDAAGLDLTSGAVLGLGLLAVPLGLPLLMLPGTALELLGVPLSGGTLQAWSWMGLASLMGVISAPCGSYMNATTRIRSHALLSALFMALGLAVGWTAMRQLGLAGAGTMRFAVVGLLALARLAIVLRPGAAPARVRRAVLLGLCILLGAFATRAIPAWSQFGGLPWVWVLLLVPFTLASLQALRRVGRR